MTRELVQVKQSDEPRTCPRPPRMRPLHAREHSNRGADRDEPEEQLQDRDGTRATSPSEDAGPPSRFLRPPARQKSSAHELSSEDEEHQRHDTGLAVWRKEESPYGLQEKECT